MANRPAAGPPDRRTALTTKALKSLILWLGVVVSVAMGVIFPVPPLLILPSRRRTERTELILPVRAGVALDLSAATVPAGMLDRRSRPVG